jgi:hypothetical protein
MYHQAIGQGEGGLIRRSRTDAGERRRARQPGEFRRRDADRGDSRLRLGCLASRLVAASAEPSRQHRYAHPCQGYPAGRRPPQPAGPGLAVGSGVTPIIGRAARDALEPADAKEPVAREPPVVSAQCLSPSREGYRAPA